MRTGAMLVTLALVAGGLVACGGNDDKETAAAQGACPAAPAALATAPKLPAGFPKPQGVTYTSDKADGPSEVVGGYFDGDIDKAFDAWKGSFGGGTGFDVTKSEHEAVDAEVNFAGAGSTGQVKLLQQCKDRTTVTVTVRPQ
jgi:hypothetical protein